MELLDSVDISHGAHCQYVGDVDSVRAFRRPECWTRRMTESRTRSRLWFVPTMNDRPNPGATQCTQQSHSVLACSHVRLPRSPGLCSSAAAVRPPPSRPVPTRTSLSTLATSPEAPARSP